VTDSRRHLPSVSALLEKEAIRAMIGDFAPRSVVVEAVRIAIDNARKGSSAPRDDSEWAAAVGTALDHATRPSLQRVINATGVVLHTNLGRAPLAQEAIDAMEVAASGYTNLEYDLDQGVRGSRYAHCVTLLCELTGAEDALVVNNNAAALVLALNTLAVGRSVAISRGELVEIGGSFRIPDIMERSGARLFEVGTTNRTHTADYEAAFDKADIAAVMKVHRSNFAMEGFVAEVDTPALARLAGERTVPLVHDLGSGLLIPLADIGLTGEPTAADVVRQGAAVVTMSGDKLLGGPQAGIIVGSHTVVTALRGNPLLRALRVDKFTIAALEATLALYRDPARALTRVPVLAMLARSLDDLRARAEALRKRLPDGFSVVDTEASVGGGAFPNARIPSVGLAYEREPQALEKRLRAGRPAVVARIADGRLLLDLRTVQSDDELADAVRAALA
jgi:L-seryl-tRNA(Ser) seleniumtransferase